MQAPPPHLSSSSAKSELQHLLTTPVPGGQSSQQHPHHHTNNNATLAHAALERLRNTGDEQYLFLRSLLECLQLRHHQQQQQQLHHHQHHHHYNSDDELLMFHCITGVRHVVLHGWRRFSSVFTEGLRDWMMLLGHSFGVSNNSNNNNNGAANNQSRTLRVACYTTSVAFWKRSWLELTATTATASAGSVEKQQHLPPDAQQQSLLEAMQQTPLLFTIPTNSLPFLSSPMTLFQYLEQSILSVSATMNQNSLSSSPQDGTAAMALALNGWFLMFVPSRTFARLLPIQDILDPFSYHDRFL